MTGSVLKRPGAKPTGKKPKAGLPTKGKISARAKSTGKAGLTAGGEGATRSPTSKATPTDKHGDASEGAESIPKARNAFQLFFAHCVAREYQCRRSTNSKAVSAEWRGMSAEAQKPYLDQALREKNLQVQARIKSGRTPRLTTFVNRACIEATPEVQVQDIQAQSQPSGEAGLTALDVNVIGSWELEWVDQGNGKKRRWQEKVDSDPPFVRPIVDVARKVQSSCFMPWIAMSVNTK